MKKFIAVKLFLMFLFVVSHSFAQQRMINGVITDSDGNPLAGATVLIKGTKAGTIADVSGKYQLDIPVGVILVFKFVGYASQELTTDGKSTLDVVLKEENVLSEIQVVGSRSYKRSVLDSPTAIDVVNVDEVSVKTGNVEINRLLHFSVPSFNANKQSGSDGADHIDPATLRGLGPDQTLVLINGKRRHQSSLVNIFGTRGRGNTGTDMNAISPSSIERIEVLRDGASAQYGSDAIAGVINIVLKESTGRLTGGLLIGANNAQPPSDQNVVSDKKLDGRTYRFNANYGVKIKDKGFVNITGDFVKKGFTNRPADPAKFAIYRQQFGNAKMSGLHLFANSKVPLNTKTHFYTFGGLSYRDTEAYAWTRTPDSERNVLSIYPGGFNPRITSIITDKSVAAGIKTKIGKWDLDFSNTYGANRFHYTIKGTVNASLGNASSTEFDAGGHFFSQNTIGLDFSRFFDKMSGVNIAFGAEYRIENFQIFAGEEGSYALYDTTGAVHDPRLPGSMIPVAPNGSLRPAGSQGFPGYAPINEVNKFRSNIAFYADGEFDFTKNFLVGAAVRFENYSDFGSTLNFKLSSRFSLSEAFSFRGSLSTGFRAPSLVQRFYNLSFTDFVSGRPVETLLASNESAASRSYGIEKLKEERATNFSLGFVAKFSNFDLTVDGYIVNIKDRIVLSGKFDASSLNIGVSEVQFFTNAIDTNSQGLDVILSWKKDTNNGALSFSLAGNFNNIELGDNIKTSPQLRGQEETLFGKREQFFLLASAPKSKINFSANYQIRKVNLNLQFTQFGEVELVDWLDTIDRYTPKTTTDLSVGFDLGKGLDLIVGSNNIFNVYPDNQNDNETESGGLWDPVQMGINGAFYYVRLGIRF